MSAGLLFFNQLHFFISDIILIESYILKKIFYVYLNNPIICVFNY